MDSKLFHPNFYNCQNSAWTIFRGGVIFFVGGGHFFCRGAQILCRLLYTVFLPNIFLSESEVFTPFPGNSPRKREFSFGKTEIAKGILFWLIRIPFFEGEFPGKGVKTSLSDKKIFGWNTVYYGRICFRFAQHLYLGMKSSKYLSD